MKSLCKIELKTEISRSTFSIFSFIDGISIRKVNYIVEQTVLDINNFFLPIDLKNIVKSVCFSKHIDSLTDNYDSSIQLIIDWLFHLKQINSKLLDFDTYTIILEILLNIEFTKINNYAILYGLKQ